MRNYSVVKGLLITAILLSICALAPKAQAAVDVKNFELLWTAKCDSVITSIKYSPDSSKIAVGTRGTMSWIGYVNSSITIFEASSGKLIKTLKGYQGNILALDWSPDGTKIVSSTGEAKIRIWNVSTGNCIRTIDTIPYAVLDIKYSPDGTKIASTIASAIAIWDASSGDLLVIISDPRIVLPRGVDWSPDGNKIVISDTKAHVITWNVSSNELIHIFNGSEIPDYLSTYIGIDWKPSNLIFSLAHNHTAYLEGRKYAYCLRIWNDSSGSMLKEIDVESRGLPDAACWSPSGTLIALRNETYIQIWDFLTGSLIKILKAEKVYDLNKIDWSGNGKYIASHLNDNTLGIWGVSEESTFNFTFAVISSFLIIGSVTLFIVFLIVNRNKKKNVNKKGG